MDDKPPFITIEIESDDQKQKNISNSKKGTNIQNGCISFLTEAKQEAMGEIERGLHNFKEVFVWCPTHNHFICSCEKQVFDLKNNLLLQYTKNNIVTQKVSLLHFFNLEVHSARTYGSVFNYRLRNRCPVFTVKRQFEIRESILSNSNSYFKIDPLQSQSMMTPQSEESAPIGIRTKRAKKRKLGENNGSASNYEPIADEITKAVSPALVNPEMELIINISDSSDDEVNDSSHLPKYGLLCLNGYGYLPIKEYNPTKVVFQHPVMKNVFVYKKNENEANIWLNDLLKSFVSSDLQGINQKWVVVQRGVLRISKTFNIKNLKTDIKQMPN